MMRGRVDVKDGKLIGAYIPMSETAYYILLSLLLEQRHGYAIMQYVEELTKGRIRLGAGTLYGTLSKMERGGLIEVTAEAEKRKIYRITSFGKDVLLTEITRIRELYHSSLEVMVE
jgi:DNA-binding PadR family transcriptional regulator